MANVRMMLATRNSTLNHVRDRLDSGSGPATISIYSGTQPADGNAPLSGNTLLATLTMSDPCAPAASGGVTTYSAITEDTTADATGTATWARVRSSDGLEGYDCDVSATGGGGTIELNTTAIVAGGPVRITAFTFAIPASV